MEEAEIHPEEQSMKQIRQYSPLLTKYYSSDQAENETDRHVADMGERTGVYRGLVGKT